MCRNIRTLFNFEPPATEDEIRASALQFVRKLSGFNHSLEGERGRVQRRGGGGVGCGPPSAAVAGDARARRVTARSRPRRRAPGRASDLLRRVAARQRPVRASELTQPTMRDLALSMSFLEKKSSGFTLSTG